jgi:tetratricopeptide (TPR) repeat protein
VASLTATDAVQATAAFRWRPEGHAIADAGTLVGMKFEAMGREDSDVYRWTFADGVVREGPSVVHVFCGASLSPVSLEVLRGGKRAGFLKQTVHVRPDWTRRAEFEDEVCKRLLAAMPDAVFGAMSSEGLSPWVAWAYQFDDAALLGRLAATCLARAKAMDAGGARALYLLGLHFQKPTLRRYEDARTVWRALLALKDAPAELRGRTAMHLGGLTLHGFGDSFGAEALFAVADGLLPEGDDRRLLDIYRGDLRVFQDRLEAAREFYLRAGTVVSPDNVHYEVRRAERLERARRFLAAGDCDDAERVLRELEWERPMERMGLETGMLLARAQQARGEKDFALQTVRRLRRVAAGEPRHSELLWLAARLLRDAGLQDEADAAVKELRRLFPYSAEAAQAGGDVRVTRPGTGSWAERASTLAQSKRWRWV